MTGTFASRAARRRTVAYAGLLATSLLLMAVSANPLVLDVQHGIAFAFRPIEVAIDGAVRQVASLGTTIADIDRLRVENQALKDDNARLRIDNQAAEELRRQNDLLTGLLQLRNGLQYHTISAVVIARETSEARRIIVIDRGTDDGLVVGDVVIAAGGALAGRIVDLGPNFARVVLISDSSSTVTGQLLSSAATGKVVGQLGGALVMQDIDKLVTVPLGEEVFTAGIELGSGARSPYPKGLLIGQVVDLARDPNEVVQTAYLQPAAPLDRLEYLLVITDYQGGVIGPLDTSAP